MLSVWSWPSVCHLAKSCTRSECWPANAFNIDKSTFLSHGIELSLSQTSPGFYVSAERVL